MVANTKIEWAQHTFNPWIGCTKVSPACDHCYAEEMMDVRYGRARWGAGEDRVRTSDGYWRQPQRWNRDAAEAGTRPFVFCASLADVFDNEVDEFWRRDLMQLIGATPNLVWLLLTKRIGNVSRMTDPARGCLPLPPNAALGATICNQEEWDRDIKKLLDAGRDNGALFTFASVEPMLSIIRPGSVLPDWIITGGESGRHARPSHPLGFRIMRDACSMEGRAYLHKQNGEWASVSEVEGPGEHYRFPDGTTVRRVGKKRAGRLLDGFEHNGMPVT